MKRNLLEEDISKNIKVNCINGYFLKNTNICYCYPGWTSKNDNFNQCDIDNGENITKFNNTVNNSQYGIITLNNKDYSQISVESIIIIRLSLFLFTLIIGILFYKYKKKKIKRRVGYGKRYIDKISDINIKRNEIIDENTYKNSNCEQISYQSKDNSLKEMKCLNKINNEDEENNNENQISIEDNRLNSLELISDSIVVSKNTLIDEK